MNDFEKSVTPVTTTADKVVIGLKSINRLLLSWIVGFIAACIITAIWGDKSHLTGLYYIVFSLFAAQGIISAFVQGYEGK
jgi:uncharacterized membrane protein YuzA (DUF378 family)